MRPYQQTEYIKIHNAWDAGYRNVCEVLPTGTGKTVLFSNIIHNNRGPSVVIAHRQELVNQISLALNRDGVRHGIVGPPDVIKLAVNTHMEDSGHSLFNAGSPVRVAGVDTLIRRTDKLNAWAKSVTLWVQDECHHLLRANKWGRAVTMFPNARGLGVTATPLRADGKGLGAHAAGVFEELLVGPGMRDIIDMGFLTDYSIFAPNDSDLDLQDVKTSSATGDYVKHGLKLAIGKSKIVGGIVKHYLRIAPGKLGVTFATDVETASKIAEEFRQNGVPAEMVCSKTKNRERVAIIRRFRRREILQLVNVDLFGEGFDLPAIEVVSFARPTQSYSVYVQQFGRGLRLLKGKDRAIIIDHVGNVLRHGLPDAPKQWSLDNRDTSKRKQKDATNLKVCAECTGVFDRLLKTCPYCGYTPAPARRDGPEYVEGDLTELTPETLARMRMSVEKIDMTSEEYHKFLLSKHAPQMWQARNIKLHEKKQKAQAVLRDSIAWWAGYRRSEGLTDSESYRKFYIDFGLDILTAQGLGVADAMALNQRVQMGIIV